MNRVNLSLEEDTIDSILDALDVAKLWSVEAKDQIDFEKAYKEIESFITENGEIDDVIENSNR